MTSPDSQQPSSFIIRKLTIDDYDKGYLQLLSQLAPAGPMTREAFAERFEQMQRCGDTYQIFVAEEIESKKLIASASLIVELKFIYYLPESADGSSGVQGHIEDVVVDSTHRGKKLGLTMIQHLKQVGNFFFECEIAAAAAAAAAMALTRFFFLLYAGRY